MKINKAHIQSLLDQAEKDGVGFYNRNSNGTWSVNMKMAHGNDPTGWANGQALLDAVGVFGRDIQPDPMSGHIVVTIKIPKE